MNLLKNIFNPLNQKQKGKRKGARFFRVTDYSRWLLVRFFAAAILLVVILIPVVKYLMFAFEGREVTTGQALIFIVQTLTTTGYGELLPFESIPMMILSILLMVSGVFIIFMIAGTLMATIIESRIIPRAPVFTQMTGHVVFTCFNETVERTIELLERHRIPYVVAAVEQNDAVELVKQGFHCICADPACDEGLKQLNVEKATLVVATKDDTENINITLGISTSSKTPVLAAMENEGRAELAYAAGAAHVVTFEETLGRQLVDWICADASPTEFLKLLDVDVSPEIITQLKPSIIHVGANSGLSQVTIGQAKIRSKTGATVAAIWNVDGSITKPTAETPISESNMIVMGPHDNVDRLASFLGGPGPGGRVVLVGAGRVGQEAGKRLNQAGISPDVIDIEERPLFFQGRRIVGDASKPHILKQAKIEEADTLIVTINNDSINIFTVLAGRQLNPNLDVVARAVHGNAVNRLRQAGANHVLSESILGFQLLQIAMVKMGVLPKYPNYVICELSWRNDPVSIRQLTENLKADVKIICVVRNGNVMDPALDLELQQQDRLVVLGSTESIRELKEFK